MNLILLTSADVIDSHHRVRLSGRRHRHILEILHAQKGDRLTVGLLNSKMGQAEVVAIDKNSVELEVNLENNPPLALALTLILALPRPQVVKRVLQSASSLGIKNIIFLNCFRVEKSLWQSSTLRSEEIKEQLILGLEQAKDTILPDVLLRKSFTAFVEEELPALIKGTLPVVAHPGSGQVCPRNVRQPVTLVIGPEGGLIDFELDRLRQMGFENVDLGERIYKVETVLPFLVGRLF
ncbi:MAG: 16S rRNA (uracil(1498)-N(3))-methyltransferase [Candidatus Omnitrophica bacterium]|nr:16S rRNA (uracil(1498)-N(3))-methyltransferase [Candidatus Omnitrophota bacterium]